MASEIMTEPFVKQMRKAMLACEDVAGETEYPVKQRAAALRRIVAYWSALADEIDPPRKPKTDAAD